MDHLDRNLGFLLHDVARLMRKRFEQNARDLGLTRSQCSGAGAPGAAMRASSRARLAEILEIEPITLTRLRRPPGGGGPGRAAVPIPTDRRIRLLRLTARRSSADRPTSSPIGAVTRGEALEGVSEEDRERLFGILCSMKANLLIKATRRRRWREECKQWLTASSSGSGWPTRSWPDDPKLGRQSWAPCAAKDCGAENCAR